MNASDPSAAKELKFDADAVHAFAKKACEAGVPPDAAYLHLVEKAKAAPDGVFGALPQE